MIKLNSNLTSGLVFLGCVLLASSAFAERRSSLAGNVLIDDVDDVFFFPQVALDHRNQVRFDLALSSALLDTTNANDNSENADLSFGENTMSGSGLLLFGEKGFAFGISTHRQDSYGTAPQGILGIGDLQLYNKTSLGVWNINGPSSPTPGGSTDAPAPGTAQGAGGAFLSPLQMADLLVAFGLGDQNSLGLRLSIGQASASFRALGAGDTDSTESWNATAINLTAGFTHKSDFELDLGLELGLAFFSNTFITKENSPNYNDSASLAPSLSLYGRVAIPLRESVKLGAVAILHINSSSFTDEFGTDPNSNDPTDADSSSQTAFNFFFEGGAGPVYELPDKTTVAAYATLGFGTSSYSLNSGDEDISTTTLLLPGFKLALEHSIVDWFTFRTGLSSRYRFNFQSHNFDDNARDNLQTSATNYEFLWSAGMGLNFGNFSLDGTFQTPFLTDGPNFLGGKETGVFGLVSVGYKF